MAHHAPIWVLLGILAAAVASTRADAQQTQGNDLFAQEQLRQGTQPTYDQFNDPETGERQPQVFDDEPIDNGTEEAASDRDESAFGRENQPADPETRRNFQDAGPSDQGNNRVQPARQVGIVNPAGELTPLANTRALPIEGSGLRRTDDPFAPLGIRSGSFLLFPTLTQTFGYTSNADFVADGEPSAFSLTSARLRAVSDWAVHQLTAEIGGSYQTFFNGTSDDLPTFDANAELRLDHTRDFTTTWGVSFLATTESASSNNLETTGTAFVTNRPEVLQGSAFAQAEKQWGRLSSRLRGTVTRTDFGDADLSDGNSLSQDDRTNTLVTATLRLGYETSPALQPFVEGTAGMRLHDEAQDGNGEKRDSLLLSTRGGFAFDQDEKLNGEIAVGYYTENFDDPSLNNLSGATIDGTINWSPQRFTVVSATAQTAFTPSGVTDESGSVTYAGSLGLTREISANLSLNARVLASLRDFEGSSRRDETVQATAGGEWRLNRNTALVGEVGYETVDSTDIDSSYDAFTARLGIRLQR